MTKLQSGLQIPNLKLSGCQALTDLDNAVRERGCETDWLSLLESEHGLILAMTRLAAERQKEERDANATL